MAGLEILHRAPRASSKKPKLLFVHGIHVGAWVWDEYFLPYFADAGFDAYAVSLRGHGQSEGKERLSQMTLSDYTEDVAEAAAMIGNPLVVIGHSLGGAVVQHWLKQGGSPVGSALLASVPPWGLAVSSMRLALMNPQLYYALAVASTSGIHAADPDVLRKGLFSSDLPTSIYERFNARVEEESMLVGMELNGITSLAPSPWPKRNVFVLGAEKDQLIPTDEIWRTAVYYSTSPVIVPDLAHGVMLDTRWEHAAKPLLDWLRSL